MKRFVEQYPIFSGTILGLVLIILGIGVGQLLRRIFS